MAKRTIATKLALDGEKEYKKAISECSKNMAVFGSELKLAAAQSEKNSKSIKGLHDQNKILSAQLEESQRKVKLSKDALSLWEKTADTARKRSDQLGIELDTASKEFEGMKRSGKASESELKAQEKKVNDLKNALDESNQTVENAERKTKDWKIALNNASAASAQLSSRIDDNKDKIKALVATKLEKFGNVCKKALTGMASSGLAAATALSAAAVSGASFADDIITTATNTGIATEKLQAYNYAQNLVDLDMESLTSSMAKNVKSMSTAAKGSKDMEAAYKSLGVRVKDSNGELRDSETVYWETVDALGEIENSTQRDAISMQIFGKSAQELNSLIAVGSKGVKEYADEAKSMGVILNKVALKDLGALDDAVQRGKALTEGWKNQIAAKVAPELSKGINAVIKEASSAAPRVINESGKVFKYISSATNRIAPQVKKVISAAKPITKELKQDVLPTIDNIVDGVESGITLVTNGLRAVEPLLSGVMKITGGITEGVTWVGNKVTEVVSGVLGWADPISESTYAVIDAVDDAGRSWQSYKELAADALDYSEVSELEAVQSALGKIVDENGKVTGSKQKLQETIALLKAQGYDVEYDAIHNQIKGYDVLQKSIQDTIAQKKYEIEIASMEEVYSGALETRRTSEESYKNAISERLKVQQQIIDENPKLIEQYGSVDGIMKAVSEDSSIAGYSLQSMLANYASLDEQVKTSAQTHQDAQTAIETYNAALSQGTSGAYAEASETINAYFDNLSLKASGGKEVVEQSVAELYQTIGTLAVEINDALQLGDITLAEDIGTELDSALTEFNARGEALPSAMTQVLNNVAAAAEQAGAKIPVALNNSIKEATPNIEFSGDFVGRFQAELDSMSLDELMKKYGSNSIDGFSQGVKENDSANKAVSSKMNSFDQAVHNSVLDFGSPSRRMRQYGMWTMDGLADGIEARAPRAIRAATSVASRVASAMRNVLQIGSPSKLTRKFGAWMGEGLSLGMLSQEKNVGKSAAKVAGAAVYEFAGINAPQSFSLAPTSAGSSRSVEVKQNLNFYGDYSARDGVTTARDLDRKLGLALGVI